MKKTSKAKNSRKDKFTATEVGTLIDQLHSDFKIFGERQNSMIEKLDATHEQVAGNTERLTILETAIRRLTERIDKNIEAITVLNQKLEDLSKSIDNLAKAKVDREELRALERRISVLETKVGLPA